LQELQNVIPIHALTDDRIGMGGSGGLFTLLCVIGVPEKHLKFGKVN